MNVQLISKWAVSLFVSAISLSLLAQNENGIDAQFRGQHRDGAFATQKPDADWASKTPQLLWKKSIGSGFSEVVVQGDILYTTMAEKTDSLSGFEYLVACNALSGEQLWKVIIDSIFIDVDGWGDGSRSTPVVDGSLVYCLSANGKLIASNIEKGKQLWQRDLVKEFESMRPRWGFSSSPLIFNDQLIAEVGGKDGKAFVAFNKSNGETLWASGQGAAGYSSPMTIKIDGEDQFLFLNGSTLWSYNASGDTLWTYALPFRGLTAIPLQIEDNKIFLSGVRTPAFVILDIEKHQATEVLQGGSMKNDFSSCVYHKGYIYGFHVAALRCISAETGETQWTKRGYGKGSLILVDDHLVVLSDKGQMLIVEATPEAFTEKSSVAAIQGKSWTAPGFNGGKIYLRNLTEMACYQL